MGEKPSASDILLSAIFDDKQKLADITSGLFFLNTAGLTILVDSGVITRTQVVDRFQEFLDAMPEELRKGVQGILLRQAIDLFRGDGPPPDPQSILRVIDGGLSQQD